MNETGPAEIDVEGAEGSLSLVLVQLFLRWIVEVLALVTLLTHCAQVTGLSFAWYCRVGAVLFLGATLLAAVRVRRGLAEVERRDGGVLLALVLLGLVGAGLAVSGHRYSDDDFQYIPQARYCLDHPDEAMGYRIRYLHGGEAPFTSLHFITSLPYDYMRAIPARLLGMEYLDIYFIHSAGLVGFLIPLALFLLVARVTGRARPALWGAACAIGLGLLLGDTVRSYGTFTFPRAFQGKVLAMTVGVPLFAALLLGHLRRPSASSWWFLAAAATGLAGASVTVVILLPPLLLMLGGVRLILEEKDRRRGLRHLALAAGALAFIVVYALLLKCCDPQSGRTIAAPALPATTAAAAGSGQLPAAGSGGGDLMATWLSLFKSFRIDQGLPASLVLVLGLTVAALLLLQGRVRRLLAGWLVAFLLLGNPLTLALLMGRVVSDEVCWRLFHLYPLPLVLAAPGVVAARLCRRFPPARTRLIGAGLLLFLAGIHTIPGTISVYQQDSTFRRPQWKLRPWPLLQARALMAKVPPGPVLAPHYISATLPLLGSTHIPLTARRYTMHWLAGRQQALRARDRDRTVRFLQGNWVFFDDFKRVLESTPELRSLVIKGEMYRTPKVTRVLRAAGLTRHLRMDEWFLVWRPVVDR